MYGEPRTDGLLQERVDGQWVSRHVFMSSDPVEVYHLAIKITSSDREFRVVNIVAPSYVVDESNCCGQDQLDDYEYDEDDK